MELLAGGASIKFQVGANQEETIEVKATVNALSSAKDPPADQFTYQ